MITRHTTGRTLLVAMAAGAMMLAGGCDPAPKTPPASTPTPAPNPSTPPKADLNAKPGDPAAPAAGTTAPTTPAKPAPPPGKPYTGPNKPIADDAKPLIRTTTASGLVLEDFAKGEANTVPAIPKSVVTFKAVGRLKVGEKPFENNYDPDQAVTANIEELMPGLREGILGMRVGGQRRIYIPSAMAFDRYGRHDLKNPNLVVVPPNTDVVFDIELMNVKFKFVEEETPQTPPPAALSSEPRKPK